MLGVWSRSELDFIEVKKMLIEANHFRRMFSKLSPRMIIISYLDIIKKSLFNIKTFRVINTSSLMTASEKKQRNILLRYSCICADFAIMWHWMTPAIATQT